MKCKIVFSDIDGTFLTSAHQISAKNALAVQNLLKNNIMFSFVSARMPKAIYGITKSLGIDIPIVCYSGALILTPEKNVVYDKRISLIDTINVLIKIKEFFPKAVVNYYAAENWYVEDKEKIRIKQEEKIVNATAYVAKFNQLINEGILPNKILCMADAKNCTEMENMLKKIYPQLNIVRSADGLLEIMDKSVSKSQAIKILLNYYKFNRTETIAFGDNYNDMDMLNYVALGVAMQNAPQEIRSMAKLVTKSNDDDGIYAALKNLHLI